MARLMYKKIGKIIGKREIKRIKKKLNYAGLKIDPYEWSGFKITFSILLAITMFLIISLFISKKISLLLSIFIGVTVYISFNIVIDLLIIKRKIFVESILPDVLSLVSINLKGGLELEEALIASSRPEFGFFSDELKRIGKLIKGGVEVDKALEKLNENVHSNVLKRVTRLIIEGINSGGKISTILEKTGDFLRRVRAIEEEGRSSTAAYFWFIIIASSIAAPLLFSSIFFLNGAMEKLFPSTTVSMLKFKPNIISRESIIIFLISILAIINFFAGMLTSVIKYGNEKNSIKYSPILIIISIVVFIITTILLRIFFGGIWFR